MNITAKADYAVRAVTELAAVPGEYLTSAEIAEAQGIPHPFLAALLQDLRRTRIVESRRGSSGGHRLARPASEITVADVIRAIEGPLAGIAGRAPEQTEGVGAAAALPEVWVATRSALREVLETVTLADVVSGRLPPAIRRRVDTPDAWQRR